MFLKAMILRILLFKFRNSQEMYSLSSLVNFHINDFLRINKESLLNYFIVKGIIYKKFSVENI